MNSSINFTISNLSRLWRAFFFPLIFSTSFFLFFLFHHLPFTILVYHSFLKKSIVFSRNI
ncbi:hypothetical protein HMPREF3206_01469 [Fusobacterium equinum]|uniref:Uncharacterized protein n=1 Tax=Fusobacterium equinum TaxID=134605 RepID=A0A133NAI7_9FUSO|nr:hypothetical protein HMPREF3206_01469 [Fusobacterium equinum]